MKIHCLHGYFKFEEQRSGELSDFMSLFGVSIERSGDHFTFSELLDAPDYSLAGGTFLGAPTLETFEGEPWEVMEANDLVYHLTLGRVVPIQTITQACSLKSSGNFYVTDGMILPGSLVAGAGRVKNYAGFFIFDRLGFKYSEVGIE